VDASQTGTSGKEEGGALAVGSPVSERLEASCGSGTCDGGGRGVGTDWGRQMLRDEFHMGSGVSSWGRSRCKPRLFFVARQPSALIGRGVGDLGGSMTGVGWRAGEGWSDTPVAEDVPLDKSAPFPLEVSSTGVCSLGVSSPSAADLEFETFTELFWVIAGCGL